MQAAQTEVQRTFAMIEHQRNESITRAGRYIAARDYLTSEFPDHNLARRRRVISMSPLPRAPGNTKVAGVQLIRT